jgi:hypothetical protein
MAGAIGIAVVSLTDTISTASVFAARAGAGGRRQPEMVGVGAVSLAAGLFQVPGLHERVAHRRGGAERRAEPTATWSGAGVVGIWCSRPACCGTSHSPPSPRS